MSIAGGLIRAIQRGQSIRCQTIQIFTKNNRQWQGAPIPTSVAEEFRRTQIVSGIKPIFAHNCYLINLGATTARLLGKSILAMTDEIHRADLLGLPFIVTHPGSHLGAGEKAGLKRVAASLREVIAATKRSKVKIALETTAGQGSSLGHRFEHLAELLHRVGSPSRLAVCVDTCHIFAAGYEIRTRTSYEKTLHEMDKVIGLPQVVAFHLNDSKTDLGARVDRHEHIGRGNIGLSPFRFLVNDARLRHLPMVLETPKNPEMTEDVVNLRTLRRLIRKRVTGD